MEKLNNILKHYNVEVYGFPAFKELENMNSESKDSTIMLATNSPSDMQAIGISVYYNPIIPRGSRFNTAQDIIDADLDCCQVTVFTAPDIESCDNVVIVSGHNATIGILKDMYPDADLLTGDITPDQIEGCNVVGNLPPTLIQYCHRYRPTIIKDYNAVTDGDLTADQIKDRFLLGDSISIYIK